uniref:T-complex protein 11-like protein 1 n=1 Tax=Styela clava TaxID=7725 RepID=UPI0019398B48|nr:T-complex protein 11-like protein 1 [Styela clava]
MADNVASKTNEEENQNETDVDTGVTKRSREVTVTKNMSPNSDKTHSKAIDVTKATTGSYENAQQDDSPSTSPPRKKIISTLKEKLANEDIAYRMKLAHEIAVDKDFRLSESSVDSTSPPLYDKSPEANKIRMEKAVKDIVQKSFWDCVRVSLESNPPKYDHAFTLLQEIKDILLSLLPANRVTSFHKRIQEYMDIELFQQQAQNDVLDVKGIALFIIDTMAAICAPVRDDQVVALRSIEDVVDMFREIHKALDLMKIDLANHAIKSIQPHIQQQQFEYERSQFAALVQESPDGLKKTRKWLTMTYGELRESLDQLESTLNLNSIEEKQIFEQKKKSALSPLSVLKASFTTLISPDFKPENIPETLEMDQKRIESIQRQVNQLVLVSTIMITSCGVFGQPLASHQKFLNRIKMILITLTADVSDQKLKDTLDGISIQCWKEAVTYAEGKGSEIGRCVSDEKESFLKNKIIELEALHTHPVYRVLYKRTVEYLQNTANTIANHISTTPPKLSEPPAGISFLTSELINVALQYAKLVNLNRTVYGPFYVPILKEILGIPKSNPTSPREESKKLPVNGDDQEKLVTNARKKLNMGTKLALPDNQKPEGKYKVTGSLEDLD